MRHNGFALRWLGATSPGDGFPAPSRSGLILKPIFTICTVPNGIWSSDRVFVFLSDHSLLSSKRCRLCFSGEERVLYFVAILSTSSSIKPVPYLPSSSEDRPPFFFHVAQWLHNLSSSSTMPRVSAIVVALGHAGWPNLHWSNVLLFAPILSHQLDMNFVGQIEAQSFAPGIFDLPAGSAGCSRKVPLSCPDVLASHIRYIVRSSRTLSPSVLYLSSFLLFSCRTGRPQIDLFGSSSLLPGEKEERS